MADERKINKRGIVITDDKHNAYIAAWIFDGKTQEIGEDVSAALLNITVEASLSDPFRVHDVEDVCDFFVAWRDTMNSIFDANETEESEGSYAEVEITVYNNYLDERSDVFVDPYYNDELTDKYRKLTDNYYV